ncbi:hypothetical protein, conserved [Trypanosoma brucei gambiense DAL972]|uniref:T. brucei spp.-specific protein n=1 Tax=Trypanosoma brucei gambiense (strain MHOM/CI/86/DAL972) TaxID=679716 RepID=C9ZJT2_TRYB9|nr:hypothetical protein, conserved [Trypanosoma brucei gambiense DAL972]CBH09642.1 hypothetical protein, conserved [Trypanosoma brucei gambiense DAL972]|eukprot:XP_011771946.1 hypothetical protein, conserved [Trypanosoma brucei gambiense DAL972]
MNRDKGKFPQLPPVLVQCNELESYLRTLNDQLAERLGCLWRNVAEMQGVVRTLDIHVKLIRTFLREHAVLTLSDKLFEDELVFDGGDAVDSFLPEFLRKRFNESATETELSRSSVTDESEQSNDIRERFGRINRICKDRFIRQKERNEEEHRLQTERMDACRRVEAMCRALEASQTTHMDKLERVSYWLYPVPEYENFYSENASGEGGDELLRDVRGQTKGARVVQELHETIRNAPIFLEFRRLLLRDVSERLAGALDQHSMDIANSNIASVCDCEGFRKGKRKNAGAVGSVDDGSISNPPDSASLAEQRLRVRNNGYIHISEVEALLNARVEATPVLNKGNDTNAKLIERRLLERIENLEERMAMYEAERKEFRKILSAVVDAHRSRHGIGMSLREAVLSSRSTRKGEHQDGHSNFTLYEISDPRRFAAKGTPPGSKIQASSSGRIIGSSPSPRGDKKAIVEPLNPLVVSGEASYRTVDTSTVARETSTQEDINMTANQAAYPSYVMGKKGCRDVENLPPLPYDRKTFK